MDRIHAFSELMPQCYLFMADISALVFSALGPKIVSNMHIQGSSIFFNFSHFSFIHSLGFFIGKNYDDKPSWIFINRNITYHIGVMSGNIKHPSSWPRPLPSPGHGASWLAPSYPSSFPPHAFLFSFKILWQNSIALFR